MQVTWLRIRITILCLGFAASLFVPVAQFDQLSRLPAPMMISFGAFAVVCFALIPFMLLFVIGIQVANPMSDDKWTIPTHKSNPFQLGNPLPFFHFGAYLNAACGLGLMVASLWQGVLALAYGVLTLAAAFMFLVGIQLCIRVYAQKITKDDA